MILSNDFNSSLRVLKGSLAEIVRIRRKVMKEIEDKIRWKHLEEVREWEYIGIDGSSSRASFRYFIMYLMRAAAYPTPGDHIINVGFLFPARIKRARTSTMLTALENLLAIYELKLRERDLMMDGGFSSGIAVRIRNLLRLLGNFAPEAHSCKEFSEFVRECGDFWEEHLNKEAVIESKDMFSLRSSCMSEEELNPLREELGPYKERAIRPILESMECLLTYDRLIEEAKESESKVIYLAKSSYSSKLIEGALGEKNPESIYLTDYMIIDELSQGRPGFVEFLDQDAYSYMFSMLYKVIYDDVNAQRILSKFFPNIFEIYERIKKSYLKRSAEDLRDFLSISYVKLSSSGDVHKIEVLNGEVEEEIPKVLSTVGGRGYPYPLKEAHRICKIRKGDSIRFYKGIISQLASEDLEGMIYGFKSSREVLGE